MLHRPFALVSSLTFVTGGTTAIATSAIPAVELRPVLRLAQLPLILQNPEAFLENFEARYIASGSMEPTLEVGDKLIIDKHTYLTAPPQREDIVLYLPPPQITEFSASEDALIHRIVGLPGEVVEVRDGQVFINEEPLEEPYLPQIGSIDYDYGPETIPNNAYFVLGDNRNNSFDSHLWGMLPGEMILGQAIGIYCPVDRQTTLDPDVESDLNRETFGQIAGFFSNNPGFCHFLQQ